MKTTTREIALAAAHDAGDRNMRKSGRTTWEAADFNAASAEFNRLWTLEMEERVA